MAKYRRKEQVVEAVQWLGPLSTDHPGVFLDWPKGFYVITKHEQRAYLERKDWILPEDVPDRFYAVKPDTFAHTYEPVEDEHEAYKLARDLSDKLEAAYLEALPGLVRAARHLRECVMLNANGQLPGGAVNVAVNRLDAVLGAPPFMGYCVEEETFQQKTDKAIKSVPQKVADSMPKCQSCGHMVGACICGECWDAEEASACAAGVQDEDEHQVFQRWVDEMACISILEQQNAHKANWINHLLGGFNVPDYTKGVVTAEGVFDD